MRHAGAGAAGAIGRRVAASALNIGRIAAKAEEADQVIVIAEDAATSGQGDLVGDVIAGFAEQGIVTVDALLLGQPQRAGEAVD